MIPSLVYVPFLLQRISEGTYIHVRMPTYVHVYIEM